MKNLLLIALFLCGSAMLTACGTTTGGKGASHSTVDDAPTTNDMND